MKSGILSLGLLGSLFLSFHETHALVLVEKGKPQATIILAQRPNRAAQFAAYELQWHIQQMTGALLPIVHDNETEKIYGVRLLVGASRLTHRLGLFNDQLRNQEYVIRFLPDTLVLMGRDKNDKTIVRYSLMPSPEELATWPDMWDEIGTMYAVYDFLERYCGVRWLDHTEWGTIIPARKTLRVEGEEVRRTPVFSYRYACYLPSENYDRFVLLQPRTAEEWEAYEQAAYPTLKAQFPDRWRYIHAKRGFVTLFRFRRREGGHKCVANHSLYGYYDRFWEPNPSRPELFVARKADWFAQGYEGRPPQMCYTNRGLIEQVAADAREYFDTGKIYPGAVASEEFFCVEPMDNAQFCQCAACQSLIQALHDPRGQGCFSNGAHSDYFFRFVNEVAKAVRTTHPNKYIVTLAYMTHAYPPRTFQLEPNVAVQFCFACNRLPYARKQYENELQALEAWSKQARQRPLYLWLYYTFPVEIAVNGQFHCFPGAFAHTIGAQMRLFAQKGFRGMFHCGYGQEIEAYVTYRLMDNPFLNVDQLLEEYFTGLYGPAGKPLLQMYLDMEQTYCHPAHYPDNPGHQTVEIAWGRLGTPERMKRYERWIEQARALAQTELQKKRLRLFELSVWEYMKQGAAAFHQRSQAPLPSVRVPRLSSGAKGDCARVEWSQAVELPGGFYERGSAKPAPRALRLLMAQDGQYLYLRLTDPCDTSKLVVSPGVFPYDTWEIFVALQKDKPYRQFAVSPSGTVIALTHGEEKGASNVPLAEHGLRAAVSTQNNEWTTYLTIPFSSLSAQGLPAERKFYMNVVRVANPALAGTGALAIYSWISHTTVHTTDRLGEIILE